MMRGPAITTAHLAIITVDRVSISDLVAEGSITIITTTVITVTMATTVIITTISGRVP